MISVVKPGLSTTVQDAGRVGYYDVGIPPSGALDLFSLAAANLLVGNDEGAAALELAYMGPVLEFGEDAVVAVAGGELTPKVDGAERPLWEAFEVPAGATLSLRAPARRRAGVRGGRGRDRRPGAARARARPTRWARWAAYEGRPLAAGDALPVGAAGRAARARSRRTLRPASPPSSRSAS